VSPAAFGALGQTFPAARQKHNQNSYFHYGLAAFWSILWRNAFLAFALFRLKGLGFWLNV